MSHRRLYNLDNVNPYTKKDSVYIEAAPSIYNVIDFSDTNYPASTITILQ